jgi:endonuclease-3
MPQKRKRSTKTATDIDTLPLSSSKKKMTVKTKESPTAPMPVKRARKQPAKRVKAGDGTVEIHPPADWELVYTTVQIMRKGLLAPVDTMGCEALAQPDISPRDQRFQTLVALMLSSQTKDTTNAVAIRKLQTELPQPGGLCLENMLTVEPEELNRLIWSVGFHNNKTRYLKATALILRDDFGGDIPDTVEGLMSLPGVGPKMAYLCLSAAWGRTEGIGVDVHVHRITNIWGWHKTKEPEETRLALQAWLPKDKWHEINHLLVGLGQTVCLPIGRKCGMCDLGTNGLCPGSTVKSVRSLKKEVKVERDDGATISVKKEEETTVKEELEEDAEIMGRILRRRTR